MNPNKVAVAVLTHHSAAVVERIAAHWSKLAEPAHIAFAYGGDQENYEKISQLKTRITDSRLLTRDHQREFQSYIGVMQGIWSVLADAEWEWLCFAEYDTVPLTRDFMSAFVAEAKSSGADLLAPAMSRIDDTLYPHYSAHAAKPGWREWLRSISLRENKDAAFYCLGCLQLWRRDCFQHVIHTPEKIPTYLELFFPTIAHHLGYRIQRWNGHEKFVSNLPLATDNPDELVKQGAMVAHPLKNFFTSPA